MSLPLTLPVANRDLDSARTGQVFSILGHYLPGHLPYRLGLVAGGYYDRWVRPAFGGLSHRSWVESLTTSCTGRSIGRLRLNVLYNRSLPFGSDTVNFLPVGLSPTWVSGCFN